MAHNLEDAHARFCRGDTEAFADIAACLMGSWRPPRAKRLGEAEEQLVQESIEDALLAYWADPGIFDAGRGVPLAYFLGQVALGYLANRTRRERRHRQRVETGLGKDFWQKGEKARTVEPWEDNSNVEDKRERLARLLWRLTPHERDEVELLCRGVRTTEAWAEILGVVGRPVEEQRREVRNAKVRLIRKLRRLASRYRAKRAPNGEWGQLLQEKTGVAPVTDLDS